MATSHVSHRRQPGRLALAATALLLAIALVLSTTPAAFADPGTTHDRLILTPDQDPATGVFVSWRSSSSAAASVEYRLPGGSTSTVAATALDTISSFTHFTAALTGLTPATTYEYRVGRSDDWTNWRSYTTASDQADPFRFIYFGDAQNLLASTWPQVTSAAYAKAPDAAFSLHAGDLIDFANSQTEWRDWFAGLGPLANTKAVIATPGNHEYVNDAHLRHWQAHFEYPKNQPNIGNIGDLANRAVGDTPAARQHASYFEYWGQRAGNTVYYVDYQGVRVISIDSERNSTYLRPPDLPACSSGCPNAQNLWFEFQAAWLRGILEDNPNQWTVVTHHRPIYSVSSGRNEAPVRAAFGPVFQEYDVDLVLNGHDHTYARGYNNADVTDTPGLTTGPVYAVSNSGGKYYSLAPVGNNVWTQNNATQVRRGANVSSFQVISVDGGTLRYESYVGARNGNPPEQLGDLYDSFTITKNALGKFVTEDGVPVPGAADNEQVLQVTVPEGPGPGEFVWAIDGSNDIVDLGVAEPSGDRFVANGEINPVRVTDTRLGGPAWSVSGQVSDFVAGSETIAATYLGWTPDVTDNLGGAEPGAPVTSVLQGGTGLAEAATLGGADAGHALGSALLGAGLQLQAPIDLAADDYAATLTLTALS